MSWRRLGREKANKFGASQGACSCGKAQKEGDERGFRRAREEVKRAKKELSKVQFEHVKFLDPAEFLELLPNLEQPDEGTTMVINGRHVRTYRLA